MVQTSGITTTLVVGKSFESFAINMWPLWGRNESKWVFSSH